MSEREEYLNELMMKGFVVLFFWIYVPLIALGWIAEKVQGLFSRDKGDQ